MSRPMTTGWLTAALLVAVMPTIHVRAQQPAQTSAPEPDLKESVAALIAKLDANSRSERTGARAELVKLGPEILPLLPAPERLGSAAAREALREIRLVLEKAQARHSIKPTYVTTVAGGMSVEDFIALVARQTGNVIDVSELPPDVAHQTVRMEDANRTFWQAIDDLTTRAGLHYARGTSSHSLTLKQQAEAAADERHVANDGAFRVEVLSADRRPIFGDTSRELLRVRLNVRAEPRLRPLFLQFAAADVKAVAGGEDLESFTPDASYELPLGTRGQEVSVRADFRVPKGLPLEQVDVSGRLTMQVAAGSETFGFNELAKSQGRSLRRGGVVTTLRKFAFDNGDDGSRATVRIDVAYEYGGPAFESHRTWVFHNEAGLEASDGNRIEPGRDFKTVQQADGAVSIEYRFEPLSEPADAYRFLYVAPTLIIDVPIPFKFSGLAVSPTATERTQP